jgi:hypothetical protein
MASAMLAIKYLRTGHDVVAGGFLVFAMGESVILLSGPAAGLAGSIPAFAAGTSLLGNSASAHQRSKFIRRSDSNLGHCERGVVYYHRSENLLG